MRVQGAAHALIPLAIFWPMAGGLLCYLIGRRSKRGRDGCAVVIAAVTLMIAVLLFYFGRGEGLHFAMPGVAWHGLTFRLDGFRLIYCVVAALMWTVTTVFSPEYLAHSRNRNRYYLFCLLTLGATLGVFFSADLFTTFVFFELMSFTSYVMVAHDETPGALRAAETYLAVAVIGGMAILLGLFLLYHYTGTLEIATLPQAAGLIPGPTLWVIGGLMMVGFGAKAGMFPLHIWLPKAHPVAPAPASALLSGVLTKSGVFGVLAVCCGLMLGDTRWGTALMIPAVVTMVLGAVLALFSVDLKRTLACSSVSQIGFILVGVSLTGILGSHNAIAAQGTVLHMLNHSIFKLLLFVTAGVVYNNIHTLNLNEIKGFGRGKPLFAFVFAMGALGIAGMPGWSGYLSKTLLHEGIVEAVQEFHGLPAAGWLQGVEILFLFTGGLTVAYMLKLSVTLFFHPGKPAGKRRYLSRPPAVLLAVCGLIPLALGLIPPLADAIGAMGAGFLHAQPLDHAVHYFAWVNLRGAVISFALGIAIYFGVVRTLLMRKGEHVDRWPRYMDIEVYLYRPLIKGLTLVMAFFARIADTVVDAIVRMVLKKGLIPRPARPFPGRFYARFYWLFYPRPQAERPGVALTGSFSFSLALFGVGLCLMLVYAVVSALMALLG